MGKDVILHRQPGCWLRSSHPFKECVIAHWSSGVAPKIHGAKHRTEAAGLIETRRKHQESLEIGLEVRKRRKDIEKSRLSLKKDTETFNAISQRIGDSFLS